MLRKLSFLFFFYKYFLLLFYTIPFLHKYNRIRGRPTNHATHNEQQLNAATLLCLQQRINCTALSAWPSLDNIQNVATFHYFRLNVERWSRMKFKYIIHLCFRLYFWLLFVVTLLFTFENLFFIVLFRFLVCFVIFFMIIILIP